MRVKEFIKMNGLKQKELADYLGITEPAVSKVVSGKANFSEDNLNKLLNNVRGWDTSMLTEIEGDSAVQTLNNSGSIMGDVSQVQGTREKELLRIISRQQEQIGTLIRMLERTTESEK